MLTRRIFNGSTMRWPNPFTELERMSQQMNQLADALLGGPKMRFLPARVFPAVNITEDKNKYYLRAELSSIKADDVNLEINNRSRQFTLSDVIAQDRIKAKLEDGTLRLTLPKAEKAVPRQITVTAG